MVIIRKCGGPMHKSWIVIVSKSNARIFERNKKKLKLVKYLENPSVSLSEKDHVSDRRGSMAQGGGYGHQSFSPKTDAKTVAEEKFAKEVNDFLGVSRNHHKYDDLVIVAEPSFLGVIKSNLNKEVNKQVIDFINKDFSNKSDSEIQELME